MTASPPQNMQTIVESLTCPITSQIMTDPVTGNDGHTYERSAIVRWLSQNPISPQTRAPMTSADLTRNVAIGYLLEQYKAGVFGPIDISDAGPPGVNATDSATTDANAPTTEPVIANTDIRLESKIAGRSGNKVRLQIGVPAEATQTNVDLLLIIDRSGSMNLPVKAKDADGKDVEDGFSQQDLVNHAANTVVKTMGEDDRLAVVIFDNETNMILPLTKMTPMNVSSAMRTISGIEPRNQTNIWGAIELALRILDERPDKSRNGAIMILTDGAPNISPARGEGETLKRYRENKNFSTPIYTIGFGYALKPGLLYEMAREGNGNTGHIPDGGMIATVFNNFIGNILCTVAINVQLNIKLLNGALLGVMVKIL